MSTNQNNKTVSAGIIIWKRESGTIKFFLCSPGGPLWNNREMWNFPKGMIDEAETPFECAVREFHEETGVYPGSLNSDDYIYHGLIKQRSDKFVHVYSKEWSGEDLGDNCYSNTFVWTDGLEYPEIGKYKWMSYDEIVGHGIKVYYPIFREIVNNN